MHCKRAKIEIALWVGNDLDAVSIGRLQRHLAICPDCRDHWQGMTTSLKALHDSSDSLLADPVPQRSRRSVWSSVSARLASPDFEGPAGRFNGWVPAIAIAAIFLAMVTIANTARLAPMSSDPLVVPADAVAFPLEPGKAGVRFVVDPAGYAPAEPEWTAPGTRRRPVGTVPEWELGGDDAWNSPLPLR